MFSKGVQKVRESVKKHGGFILSTDTLNMVQLVLTARDFIVYNKIEEGYNIVKDVNLLFDQDEDLMKEMFPLYFNGTLDDRLNEQEVEELEYIWAENIYNLFNDIAPEGFYFGSSEGDGACIGFFEYDEEWED